jgi:hypothetical protein
MVYALAEYLNSPEVKAWLKARCQRAANNYIRLQSHVISEIRVPETLILKKMFTNERSEKGGVKC